MTAQTPEEVVDWLRDIGKVVVPMTMFQDYKKVREVLSAINAEAWQVFFVAAPPVEATGKFILKRSIKHELEPTHDYGERADGLRTMEEMFEIVMAWTE